MALYYEDVSIGDTAISSGRTITETDVVMYAGLSGDYNPLHMDAEFAATTPFGQRIAHGPLGFTIAIGLSSQLHLFEGTAIAALGIEQWQYLAPILIGDTLHVEIEVVDRRLTADGRRGILVREFRLYNQTDTVVQRGICPVMVKLRELGSPAER